MAQSYVPVKTGLLELLRGNSCTQYVIPVYQRNYTWSKREVNQLFEDLKDILYGKRTKHFIGIMIYLEKSLTPFQNERSVIDGQQRLTTLFLILYAIKEILHSDNENEKAKTLENTYLINSYSETNKFKLKPLVSDDEVYKHIVTRDFRNIPDQDSNVWKNYCLIKKYLEELLCDFTIDNILNTLDRLYIVCVPIGEEDYPQKIFESINATGAKLTASDLIRNFMLMPISSDKQDEYFEKYWKKIELYVSRDAKKMEAFFRFFIMAKNRTIVNKNAVYASFTKWYYEKIGNPFGTEELFREILDYAYGYYVIYNAPIENVDEGLRNAIREYREIESEMPVALLLELYVMYDIRKNISSQQLSEIMMILVSYLMRRSLCNIDTSIISNYFPDLLRYTLSKCQGEYTNIVEIFKSILIEGNRNTPRAMPTDRDLREYIKSANMYELRSPVKAFFCKWELEGNNAPVNLSTLSIEHLIPQTSTVEWLEKLAVSQEEYEEKIHRLGNLTLAAKIDNSKMGNKNWEYKKKQLSQTEHLRINKEILQKDFWTIKDIDTRTDSLIEEIIRLYPDYREKAPIDNVLDSVAEGSEDLVSWLLGLPEDQKKSILQKLSRDAEPSAQSIQQIEDKQEIRRKTISEKDRDRLLQIKKVDLSFLSTAITLEQKCHEDIHMFCGGKLKLNEKKPIKIRIDGSDYNAISTRYNHDNRGVDVIQIQYRDSYIKEHLRAIFDSLYENLCKKKDGKDVVILDRYVSIYLTSEPDVIKFVVK